MRFTKLSICSFFGIGNICLLCGSWPNLLTVMAVAVAVSGFVDFALGEEK